MESSTCTDLPDLVMIISVPRSLNLSHKSLVSRWHTTCRSSSQLKRSCSSGFLGGDGEDGGDFLPPRPPECPALQSDVDDEISGGLSRPSSSNSSSLLARGVVGSGELLATEEEVVVVSTNFSETVGKSIRYYRLLSQYLLLYWYRYRLLCIVRDGVGPTWRK